MDRGAQAHRQLVRLAKVRAAVDAEIARWLLVAEEERVHIALGFGTFLEYVERTLGYRPRTALERLRVARELERLPEMKRAVTEGDVSYSAARELTRFVEPETEREWIGAVVGKTMREVEELSAGREPGDRPGDPAKPALVMRRLLLALPPEVYARWLQVRRLLEDEAGGPVEDCEVMAALCDQLLAGDAHVGTRAETQIAITTCRECKKTTLDAAGQVIEISDEALACAECDATHLDLDQPHAPVTKEIPDRVRRHVERRAQMRCVFPGCRSSRTLQVHHVDWRVHGGDHDPSNLALVCLHHHNAIHNGRVFLRGTAPDQLVFEHADGRPYGARSAQDEDPPPRRAHVSTLAELSAYVDAILETNAAPP